MLLDFKAVRDGRSTQVFGVAPDDALLRGYFGRLTRPIDVTARIVEQPHQTYLVTLETRGEVEFSCRRCLSPVRQRIDERTTLFFEVLAQSAARAGVARSGAAGPGEPRQGGEEDSEVLPLRSRTDTVDLGPATREALFLATESFPLCSPGCRGLCPGCGEDLNVAICRCAPQPAGSGSLRGLENFRP
jgi:uncharacterized protein